MGRTEEERFTKSMRGEIVKQQVARNEINGYNEYVSNFRTIHFTKEQAYSILRNVARQQRSLGRIVKNETSKNRGYEGGYYGHRLAIFHPDGHEMFMISASKQINGKYTIHVWRREMSREGKKIIYAKHGFHGTITHPTRFIIGEGRYPERVNVTPIKPGHKKKHYLNRESIGENHLSLPKVDIGNIKIKKFI